MRIVINEKLTKRNRRIATYLFLATFVVLIGGFVFINYSVFTDSAPTGMIVLLQALILPIAFVLTIASVRMTNLWARRPYPEEAFKGNIKGMSKKSVMYHYYHLPARHVLIAPQGIFAVITRWHGGKFTVKGDKWKTHKSAIARFFSMMRMDGIGDPNDEAKQAAAHVKKLLASIAPNVDVQPLIILTDPSVQVTIEDSSIPILFIDDKQEPNLTDYLRDLNRQQKENPQKKVVLPLTDAQLKEFEIKTTGKFQEDTEESE